jgi:DNA-binding transcriptional regulator YiaG
VIIVIRKTIVVNLYKKGIALNKISQELNTPLMNVLEILETALKDFQYAGAITFSQDHIKEILVHYEDFKISSKLLAKKFGHCKKTILKILRQNNMRLRPSGNQKIMKEDEPLIIKMKLDGIAIKEIADHFGVSTKPILRVLHKNNVEVEKYRPTVESQKKARKYQCNTKFFSVIDTAVKAYFLGLFAADGSFIRNKQGDLIGIQIGLKKSSAHILIKFLQCIESNDRLRKTSYVYKYKGKKKVLHSRVAMVFSKELAEDVRRQLQLPDNEFQKTYDLVFPYKMIPKSFVASFIRGVFDGDGTINYYPNSTKKEKDMYISFYGTKKLLEGIRTIICENCLVNFAKVKPKRTDGEFNRNTKKDKEKEDVIDEDNLWELSWSGRKQILEILDWMYKGETLFIEEKYRKYKSIDRKKAIVDLVDIISVAEIKEKRKKLGLSQLGLARAISCSGAVISDYERNIRTKMSYKLAKRLLDFFEIKYDKDTFFY